MAIISGLPNNLANGTTADASQVMANFNQIVNNVNANAAPLSNTALLNANNNFTSVQSGIVAAAGANFPIASQVQNWAFNTLTSTLGTNAITARIAQLPLSAYAVGQVFTFIPSQTNTGAVGITIDAAGSSSVFSRGASLSGGELVAGVPAVIERDATKFNLLNDDGNITLATEQASTSGTSIDFTGIPSGVKRITVMFLNVSTNGTDDLLIQIGDSGGIETGSYAGSSSLLVGTVNTATSTAGFLIHATGNAATQRTGAVTLSLERSSNFTWVASGVLAQTDTGATVTTAGAKATSAELDRVRITTVSGVDTFDAGAIAISYE